MRRLVIVMLAVAAVAVLARGAVPCTAFSLQPACYVALKPGPTTEILGILSAPSERTYSSTGELLLTTIQLDDQLHPVDWLRNGFSPRVDLVPRHVLFPPGKGAEVVRTENVAQMDASQLNATAAALEATGRDVDLTPQGAEVLQVLPELPAAEVLEHGDVIVQVDGVDVTDAASAVEAIEAHEIGDEVTLEVRRGDEELTVELTLVADPQDPSRPEAGAVIADHIVLPVEVQIDAGDIGGPSAGLMFAVAIVDILTAEDLTGGATIAGTGSLTPDGVVGAIGGVRQKILGSVERASGDPAEVFLVPEGNFAEARGAPTETQILLVPVTDLDDALTSLRDLREGRTPDDAHMLGA